MNLVIRKMRAVDAEIEALAAMRHAAFFAGSARTRDIEQVELAAFVRRGGTHEAAVVAEVDGRLAGCCLLAPREIDQQHEVGPWLAGLIVEPGLRRRGIGAALVRAVENEARRRAVSRLFLYTSTAQAFYAALGWRALDDFIDGDGEASTLMAMDLAGKGLPE